MGDYLVTLCIAFVIDLLFIKKNNKSINYFLFYYQIEVSPTITAFSKLDITLRAKIKLIVLDYFEL